jgi:hypothetical protein
MIIWARKSYPGLCRSELAATVCEILDWNTPSGRAKMQQCMEFFNILELEGIVQLPPIQTARQHRSGIKIPQLEFKTAEISGDIREYEPIRLVIVRPGADMKRWRAYVNQYHILGDKHVFGSQLRYLIKSGDTELGCMQFSASSWSLEAREKWIGWTREDRKQRLHLILNNSRYLIFPWVHIRNLASKALSLAAKQIQDDWLREYCYAPVLLETFVDSEKYRGVSYKAANWIYLGSTKGIGRNGGKKRTLSIKSIYAYPLQDDFRACLKGEKPHKVVIPE